MSDEESVRESLKLFVEEALSLRFGINLPSEAAGPQAVLGSLLDFRQRSDRLENIYIRVMQIRARLARHSAAVKAESDDAWANAISKARNSTVTKNDQFVGPRERYAEADLETLQQKRAARKAEDLLSVADEASDVIRTALRGLNDAIQDHRTWLRALQFQSHLEN